MTERANRQRSVLPRQGRALLAWSLVAAALVACAGCATSFDKRGVYYKVRSGDSIWRIARIYRTDVQRLAEYNNILDPKEIEPGMRLYIPPRQRKVAFKKLSFGEAIGSGEAVEPGAVREKKKGADKYSKPIQVYRGRFIWPVDGRVVSPFGYRDGRRHDGIDISGSDGTPIRAAAAGKVVFAGSMRGYGNLVLIRHKDDLFTAYAHNSRNKVQGGQMVKQGQVIGEVGHTGRATGPHLHFELRHGQTARNPLFFLPAREGAASARMDRGSDDSEEDDLSDAVGNAAKEDPGVEEAASGAPRAKMKPASTKQVKVGAPSTKTKAAAVGKPKASVVKKQGAAGKKKGMVKGKKTKATKTSTATKAAKKKAGKQGDDPKKARKKSSGTTTGKH